MTRFVISRENGQSDAEVLANVIRSVDPGSLVSYTDIADKLTEGTGRTYSRIAVQSAVARAERKLATELCRALVNVRGQGYRVALAAEHQLLAGRKKDKAGALLKRGLTLLQHVDWDQMDENARMAHEGQLMVVGALHSAMTGIDRRMRRIEDALLNRNK